MKYAVIKDSTKVVSIKEIDIDKVNFTITINSMKDEVYVEQYVNEDETLNRLLSLHNGFNNSSIIDWWNGV
jgi:hypothetical protein|tara:strand:+ start:508 stop:720 length:213 start_codon:yes stop_codon:yes gene_type:complete